MRKKFLALALLVARVLANHHHVSVATNDLAFVADFLYRGVDLHECVPFFAVFVPDVGPLLFSSSLLVAINDAASREVVWAQFHDDLVLREDSDVVLTHLARDVSKNFVAVRQLHAEHGVGQRFDNRTFDFDDAVFLAHKLTYRWVY